VACISRLLPPRSEILNPCCRLVCASRPLAMHFCSALVGLCSRQSLTLVSATPRRRALALGFTCNHMLLPPAVCLRYLSTSTLYCMRPAATCYLLLAHPHPSHLPPSCTDVTATQQIGGHTQKRGSLLWRCAFECHSLRAVVSLLALPSGSNWPATPGELPDPAASRSKKDSSCSGRKRNILGDRPSH
jgi:hypothetical protein